MWLLALVDDEIRIANHLSEIGVSLYCLPEIRISTRYLDPLNGNLWERMKDFVTNSLKKKNFEDQFLFLIIIIYLIFLSNYDKLIAS
jgi:hypothetical protein